MIYVDTSAIMKLYVKETDSQPLSEWIIKNDEPLPLTSLIELEFINALKLKQFRNEISRDDFDGILLKLQEHEQKGVYYRPPMDWIAIFSHAFDLSKTYTGEIGSRSLDILHIASALILKIEKVLTFDERQTQLASAAGLIIEKC